MTVFNQGQRPPSGREAENHELEAELRILGDRLRDLERSVRELRTQFDRVAGALGAGEANPASVLPPANAADNADTDKMHQDARRYARLLVSEIELYNPAEVARGRESKDLYDRLRFHIERSRKAYEDKFKSLSGPDYFDEEVLRSLAQNDLTLLGPDYHSRSA